MTDKQFLYQHFIKLHTLINLLEIAMGTSSPLWLQNN